MQQSVAFITGVSGGIGKALALELLTAGFQVWGIGRTNNIQHKAYSFIHLDLTNREAVENFVFPVPECDHVILVNNAGIIGTIKPVGSIATKEISNVMQTNAIAPQQLMNQFIHQFLGRSEKLHVLNISSGAGKRPIDAWASYCASKSALDLFSWTASEEIKARNYQNVYIHCLAPGVVDTAMQALIRQADPKDFLASQRFHDLYTQKELLPPKMIAEKLKMLIQHPEKYSNVLINLSDI